MPEAWLYKLNLTARSNGWVIRSSRTFSFSGQTRLLKEAIYLQSGAGKHVSDRNRWEGRTGGLFSVTGKDLFQNRITRLHMLIICGSEQYSALIGLSFTGYHYKIDDLKINFEDPDEPWLKMNYGAGYLSLMQLSVFTF